MKLLVFVRQCGFPYIHRLKVSCSKPLVTFLYVVAIRKPITEPKIAVGGERGRGVTKVNVKARARLLAEGSRTRSCTHRIVRGFKCGSPV